MRMRLGAGHQALAHGLAQRLGPALVCSQPCLAKYGRLVMGIPLSAHLRLLPALKPCIGTQAPLLVTLAWLLALLLAPAPWYARHRDAVIATQRLAYCASILGTLGATMARSPHWAHLAAHMLANAYQGPRRRLWGRMAFYQAVYAVCQVGCGGGWLACIRPDVHAARWCGDCPRHCQQAYIDEQRLEELGHRVLNPPPRRWACPCNCGWRQCYWPWTWPW